MSEALWQRVAPASVGGWSRWGGWLHRPPAQAAATARGSSLSGRLLLALAGALVGVAVARGAPDAVAASRGVAPPDAAPEAATPRLRAFSWEAMGTRFELQLPEVPGAPEAARSAAARVEGLEAVMSEWRPGSPLAEVNRLAGMAPVAVPAELRDVLRRGLEIGGATRGAFDVTWAALWGLWDFRRGVIPDPAEIDRRLPLIDYRSVVVDAGAGTVFLPWPGQAIGLGGIAKGWALDAVAADLRRAGLPDFLLSAGGQVLAGGQPGPTPWRIGIRDPRGAPDDWFAAVSLVDGSISTSGDYERYFEAAGVRYHHIVDPRSGRPARGLRSATVSCADATTADALSTAVFVLGVRDGLELVERWAGAAALLVDDEGRVHRSSGWSELWLRHEPRDALPRSGAEEHR